MPPVFSSNFHVNYEDNYYFFRWTGKFRITWFHTKYNLYNTQNYTIFTTQYTLLHIQLLLYINWIIAKIQTKSNQRETELYKNMAIISKGKLTHARKQIQMYEVDYYRKLNQKIAYLSIIFIDMYAVNFEYSHAHSKFCHLEQLFEFLFIRTALFHSVNKLVIQPISCIFCWVIHEWKMILWE